jgi:hypothetical protein
MLVALPVYAPVPKEPLSVVVETPVARLLSVLYAKPRVVAFEPPVDVMFPFSVAVVCVTEVGAWTVTVGAVQADVVNPAEIDP